MRPPLVTIVAALCLACTACNRHKERYPVRWTEHVTLGSLAEADSVLDQPLVTVNGQEVLEMSPCSETPPAGEPGIVQVRTVREFLRYEALGYAPRTNYDIAVEGWFKRAAVPVRYLKHAQASEVSYLADLDLSKRPVDLPGRLGPWGPSENTCEELDAMSAGKTWDDLWPDAGYTNGTPQAVTIEVDGLRTSINILAWGDFNDDRIEDVLLFVVNHALEATFHSYECIIITRLTPGGPVEIVDED